MVLNGNFRSILKMSAYCLALRPLLPVCELSTFLSFLSGLVRLAEEAEVDDEADIAADINDEIPDEEEEEEEVMYSEMIKEKKEDLDS